MKKLKYIPYIKYVISAGTRFERDKKVLFDPDGEVSRGLPLINYGWAPNGLKEVIQAFYEAKYGTLKGFDTYYEKEILGHRGNIVSKLIKDELIENDLPILIVIKVKDDVEVPALLAKVDRMYFKYCDECSLCWRNCNTQVPSSLMNVLEELGLEFLVNKFQCTRQICKFLCENYNVCVKNYTSKEDDPITQKEKVDCIIELLKQLSGKSPASTKYECRPKTGLSYTKLKNQIRRPENRTKCIERNLRFDFIPLRYLFFDHKTWLKIQREKYNKKGFRPNMNVIPSHLFSDFIHNYKEYNDGTGLIAPTNHEGVLEAFLNVSKIRFEIKIKLIHKCSICGQIHQLLNIPIKAMFRDSEVFKHESGFAELIWQKLWEKYPKEFCKYFDGRAAISMDDNKVLRRELEVKEIYHGSPFASCSYDFAVDMTYLKRQYKLLLFDLTTGLWKKSGFHELSRTPQDYLETWRETLYKIPIEKENIFVCWYIVINSTEEVFFDETSPEGIRNMDQLIEKITSNNLEHISIIKKMEDVPSLNPSVHKLIVIPIFNTTQQKGEARLEIRRLERKEFNKLLIWNILDKLIE